MLAQIFLQLLCAFCRNYRLVSLPHRNGALKSSTQIAGHHRYAAKYFSLDVEDPLLDLWNWDVFMYLDGRETAAYGLAIVKPGVGERRWKLPFADRKELVPYVSFYSLMVVEQHRGQGLCDRLLRDMVDSLRASHGLRPDTLLTLHLSPSDPLMFVAAKVYYRMGFTRGVFSTAGPMQFQHQTNRLVDESCDMYAIMDDRKASALPGGFITLYCRLKDFGKPRQPPPDCIEKGKELMKLLGQRAAGAV